MPRSVGRPCSKNGCPEVVYGSETDCPEHKRERQRLSEFKRNERPSRQYAVKQTNTARYRKARKMFLARNPLCVECQRNGIVKASAELDHIIPHKGDPMLFWDQDNWQGLCVSCHSRKTATEDGGWGGKINVG